MAKGIPKSGINRGWFKAGQRASYRGLTYEQRFGLEKAALIRSKLRTNHKGLSGRHHTPEAIEKIRNANTNPSPLLRALRSQSKRGSKNPMYGRRSPNWRGGVTPINEQIRRSVPYKQWRKAVFIRDDYTCQGCGKRGGELQADHELPFSVYPDLRFEILNGRTFCKPCHLKTPTWGSKALTSGIN